MRCINCNNEINNNSNFCKYCGYKLTNIGNEQNIINNSNINASTNSNVNNNNNNTNNNYNDQIINNGMNQNINNDFKTWEGVTNLFRSVKCIGRENCFFLTFKNGRHESAKSGIGGGIAGGIGGVVGALIGAGVSTAIRAASSSSELIKELEAYEGLLMNKTEIGIGIIPLTQKGVQVFLDADKLYPIVDKFIFIPNQYIENIEIKNFNLLNKGMQKVNIKLTDGNVLHEVARLKEKSVVYQETEFARFMNLYKK